MALNVQGQFKKDGQILKSGDFATFKYSAAANEPTPVIVFINYITGIYPTTGHQGRLIQGISTSYIPRKDRKKFVKDWYESQLKNKNTKFTGQLVKRKYPYIKFAIRRFQTKPNYYISNFRKLEGEEIGKEVVRNGGKDFSKFVKRKIFSFLKKKL